MGHFQASAATRIVDLEFVASGEYDIEESKLE